MSDASPKNEPGRVGALSLVLLGLALACGRQDGIVGVQPLDALGMSGAPATPLGFSDEFATNSGIWQEQTELWHPASHWYPSKGAADYPAGDVTYSSIG